MLTRRALANILIILGVSSILIGLFFYWQRVSPRRLKFDLWEVGDKARSSSGKVLPKGLVISGLDIVLPVFPTEVRNGKWQATSKGVLYLVSTPIPGEVGNSIIYGHNWKSILGNLEKIVPGQEIDIYYSDGSRLTFKVTHTQVVSPSQTKILDQTKDRRITLYTCTGFLDSKRFVVTALLKDGQSLSFLY